MFRQTAEGVSISLHVLPNAPKSEIIGPHNNCLKIKIKSPPIDGKANECIEKFFAELLGLPKKNIELIHGEKSKQKTLLVRGTTITEVKTKLKL